MALKLFGFIDMQRAPVFVHIDDIRRISYDDTTGGSQITYQCEGGTAYAYAPNFDPIALAEALNLFAK